MTSGYNSDAVSDHDHDYENVVFFKGSSGQTAEAGGNENLEEDEEDNYVILRAVKDEHNNAVLVRPRIMEEIFYLVHNY